MAKYLASIHGTEKDHVNCPFYFKVGACLHGDRCSRLHNRPSISPTLLLRNMYRRLDMIVGGASLSPSTIQQHFEDFYEDVFDEFIKYGEIETLKVCDNLVDHLVGNVYVQFKEAEQAAKALQALQGRFYEGRLISVEFSPVTDFREAVCRQFKGNKCNQGGKTGKENCNFIHVKEIGKELKRELFGSHHQSPSSSPRRDMSLSSRCSRRYDNHLNCRQDCRQEVEKYSRDVRRQNQSPEHERRPIRDVNEERRARIEEWNKEKGMSHRALVQA